MIDYSDCILESCLNTTPIEREALNDPIRYIDRAYYECVLNITKINLSILAEGYTYLKENGGEDKETLVSKIKKGVSTAIKFAVNKVKQIYLAIKRKINEFIHAAKQCKIDKIAKKMSFDKINAINASLTEDDIELTVTSVDPNDMKNAILDSCDAKKVLKDREISKTETYAIRTIQEASRAVSLMIRTSTNIDAEYKHTLNLLRWVKADDKFKYDKTVSEYDMQNNLSICLSIYSKAMKIQHACVNSCYKHFLKLAKKTADAVKEEIKDQENPDKELSDFVEEVADAVHQYNNNTSEEDADND